MVKLNDVINAVMHDISRAQTLSDTYSQNLKSTYEEDAFLSLLSVPHTKIKEVTIDLKFAVLNDNEVVIYQGPEYSGHSQKLKEGSYDSNTLDIDIDTLISVKVPKGMKITFYEQAGFQGEEMSFTENTSQITCFDGSKELNITPYEDNSLLSGVMSYSELTSSAFPWSNDWSNDKNFSVIVEKLVLAEDSNKEGETLNIEVDTNQLSQMPENALSSISLTLDLNSL